MKLKTNRQYLEDLNSYFLPFMKEVTKSHARLNQGTDIEYLNKICFSVLNDIHITFQKKLLTSQQKFTITFKEAEGIIFMKGLISFPVPADHFWRNNMRNQIIEQLHKQIS